MPKLKSDDGSERRTENSDDGSERQTENSDDDGSERQTENSDGSERQNWKATMALNAELKTRWWLWTPKLKSDDSDSERQTEKIIALEA